TLEIQIRTHEMHQVAEYGVAAHWRYKEGLRQDQKFDAKVAWLRQLMDWQKDVAGGAQEFVDSLRSDIFQDQVYVFTPKGEIKELPSGATSLDFAYRIHTDVGHKCVGAKVNGRLVSRSEEHTSELQSRFDLVCRLLLEKTKILPPSRIAKRSPW